MKSCIFCTNIGKERKLFFPGKPMCDQHYIGYLEFLIEDFEDEITDSDKQSTYERYKIKLEPKPVPIKPIPKPKPTPYSSNPFKMGM